MKKLNLLSRVEMKNVVGGVPLASYCGEGQVLAECTVGYPVSVHNPGSWDGNIWNPGTWTTETHYTTIGGCMPAEDYYANQANCRLIGTGGPYAL